MSMTAAATDDGTIIFVDDVGNRHDNLNTSNTAQSTPHTLKSRRHIFQLPKSTGD